jgi:hypothetical protein
MHLSQEEVKIILETHCRRYLDMLNKEELYSYALNSMMSSYDKDPEVSNTDLKHLVGDIIMLEGNDTDSASEFLTGCGLSDDNVDQLISDSLIDS